MKMHLVIPMAGRGSRFNNYNVNYPKPMIPIQEKPFFYWATESIAKHMDLIDITFVVLKEHVQKYSIDKEIMYYYPNAIIHVLDDVLDGAVLTCLHGIQNISDEYPIVFNDCDHMFSSNHFYNYVHEYNKLDFDGAFLTFFSSDPKYSYAILDENKNVFGTIEKMAASNYAICGCYIFKSKELFESLLKEYLNNCTYNEYYLSGLFNILSSRKSCIQMFETDYHIPFGVPEEYEIAKSSNKFIL